MQCDVCGEVVYISNKFKYIETEVRYARAVKTFQIRGVPSNVFISFHIPL